MSGLSGLYDHKLSWVQKMTQIWNVLMKECLPELSAFFEEINLPDLIWITKWVQTCFLYSFPFRVCLRIWDNIFAYGTNFMFCASLGILS